MAVDTVDDLQHLRVDQIGTLVAPQRLKENYARYERGNASGAELQALQDELIRDVIRKQEAVGLPVLTDGEFRRGNFQESFAAAVSGFEVPAVGAVYDQSAINTRPLERAEQNFEAPGPAIFTRRPVVERLTLKRNVVLDEYRFAAALTERPVKATLLSPDRIAQRFAHERSRHVYRDLDDFTADVVAIERRMIADLVAAGCHYVQIDAPGYTAYVDPVSLERMRARGEDPDENLARSIRADNALIAGFPGVIFGIHVCRGNPRTVDPATGKVMAQWHREGPYDAIAERLFGGLDHHRLLLEYDSERAGGFAPLRYVPKGKIAVLGLVTTKSAELEPVDALKRRIDEASRYLPLDSLALSPQCGFGGVHGISLAEEDQWRKFARILETAREVWG